MYNTNHQDGSTEEWEILYPISFLSCCFFFDCVKFSWVLPDWVLGSEQDSNFLSSALPESGTLGFRIMGVWVGESSHGRPSIFFFLWPSLLMEDFSTTPRGTTATWLMSSRLCIRRGRYCTIALSFNGHWWDLWFPYLIIGLRSSFQVYSSIGFRG